MSKRFVGSAALLLGTMVAVSGQAFGSTGCDLVNALGTVPAGTAVMSGAGAFDVGDTVKFLLPSEGAGGGLTWSELAQWPHGTPYQQSKTPHEFVYTFDVAVDSQTFRFTNGSVGDAFPSCIPASSP
jgi:hypothetical protein